MPVDFEKLIGQLEAAAASAREANERRYQQAQAIYDEIVERYRPGGAFETAHEQLLQTAKRRDVAGGMQALVSGGMVGTTRAAGLGRAWEEEVGAPARLQRSDILMQRLSQAQIGKAGLTERREDIGPSYGDIFEMARAGGEAGAAGGRTVSTITHTTPSLWGRGTEPAGTYATRQRERQKRMAEEERLFQERRAAARQPTAAATTQEGGLKQRTPPAGEIKTAIDRIKSKGKASAYEWDVYKEYLPASYNPQYKGYVAGVKKLGGTQIATRSEYEKIQEAMRKKYPGRGY